MESRNEEAEVLQLAALQEPLVTESGHEINDLAHLF
jgi:hypothetical protein